MTGTGEAPVACAEAQHAAARAHARQGAAIPAEPGFPACRAQARAATADSSVTGQEDNED